jgi:hypothetical protein
MKMLEFLIPHLVLSAFPLLTLSDAYTEVEFRGLVSAQSYIGCIYKEEEKVNELTFLGRRSELGGRVL